MKKKKNEVAEMLVLILQIGISMIVPIALMVILSMFVADKTGIKWISVILFVMGAAAGIRNVYKLVSKYLKKQKEPYEIAKEEAIRQKEADKQEERSQKEYEESNNEI